MSVAGIVFALLGDPAIEARTRSIGLEPDDVPFMKSILYSSLIADLDAEKEADLRRLAAILDPVDDPDPVVKQTMFEELIVHFEELFDQKIAWIIKKLLPGRAIVRKAVADRKKLMASGEILLINHYVPLEMHKDLISGDEPKKHAIKYIVMPRAVGDFGVYALRWRQPFRKLKFAGMRDEALSGCLQGMNGQGWVHPNGTVAAWNGQQYAIDYVRQTLKSIDKAPNALPILN
jgi:uncharacterized UPF0160 family protein